MHWNWVQEPKRSCGTQGLILVGGRGRIGKREKSHGDPNPTRLWPTLHELEEYYPSKLFHVRLNWPGL